MSREQKKKSGKFAGLLFAGLGVTATPTSIIWSKLNELTIQVKILRLEQNSKIEGLENKLSSRISDMERRLRLVENKHNVYHPSPRRVSK